MALAMEAMEVQVRVPPHLYQRLEQTARLAKCTGQDVAEPAPPQLATPRVLLAEKAGEAWR